jgi:hypothetical protein
VIIKSKIRLSPREHSCCIIQVEYAWLKNQKSKTFWVTTGCHKWKIPLHKTMFCEQDYRKYWMKWTSGYVYKAGYEIRMNFIFWHGSHPQDVSYICKYSKIQKQSEIQNTSDIRILDKRYSVLLLLFCSVKTKIL